jgi:DNA adenine methylase
MRKAFLKWAGGKRKLLSTILAATGTGSRFIEPFCGSAVVGLNADFEKRILIDVNQDLINLYRHVVADVSGFLRDLENVFTGSNEATQYYKLRNEFNDTIDTYRRSILFVYLNRHCFNGLCRYNRSGGFNVPYGKYKNPSIPADALREFAEGMSNAQFLNMDFRDALSIARDGDVVYCDPPYVPLNLTSNFTSYSVDGFSEEDQRDLARLVVESPARVVLSNHDVPSVREMYEGCEFQTISVHRSISSIGDSRGAVQEVLIIKA